MTWCQSANSDSTEASSDSGVEGSARATPNFKPEIVTKKKIA